MKKILPLVVLFSVVFLNACYKDIGPVEGDETSSNSETTEEVSFSQDVQPIFDAYCVSCHPPSGSLDLRPGYSYNDIVNVPASNYNGILVVPGDAEASVLYKKIDGSGAYGPNMPLGGMLSSTQIAIIRNWINQGAPNN